MCDCMSKEFREGASFEKLFDFSNQCVSPVKVKKMLTQWICMNLIIGNKDAHGKNISFFINKNNTIEIAPLYDITNVSLYGDVYEQDFAMAFGDQFIEENLSIDDFQEFCFNADISFYIFKKELLSLCQKSIDILNTIQLLTKHQVNVISQKEGLRTLLEDGTENPTAKLLVGILGTLAEFELTRIKERQAEGIANAKDRGVYKTNGGNRVKETRTKFLSKSKNALCLKELQRGNSVRRSAKLSGVSLMTAQKVKNYMSQE